MCIAATRTLALCAAQSETDARSETELFPESLKVLSKFCGRGPAAGDELILFTTGVRAPFFCIINILKRCVATWRAAAVSRMRWN